VSVTLLRKHDLCKLLLLEVIDICASRFSFQGGSPHRWFYLTFWRRCYCNLPWFVHLDLGRLFSVLQSALLHGKLKSSLITHMRNRPVLTSLLFRLDFLNSLVRHPRSWLLSGEDHPTAIFEIIVTLSLNILQVAVISLRIRWLIGLNKSLTFIPVLLILLFLNFLYIFFIFGFTIKYL